MSRRRTTRTTTREQRAARSTTGAGTAGGTAADAGAGDGADVGRFGAAGAVEWYRRRGQPPPAPPARIEGRQRSASASGHTSTPPWYSRRSPPYSRKLDRIKAGDRSTRRTRAGGAPRRPKAPSKLRRRRRSASAGGCSVRAAGCAAAAPDFGSEAGLGTPGDRRPVPWVSPHCCHGTRGPLTVTPSTRAVSGASSKNPLERPIRRSWVSCPRRYGTYGTAHSTKPPTALVIPSTISWQVTIPSPLVATIQWVSSPPSENSSRETQMC